MYHKYYTKMHITHLRLIGVVDINLARAIHWTRWGLTRSSPLKVDVIQTIDIFIGGCYLYYFDFMSQNIWFFICSSSFVALGGFGTWYFWSFLWCVFPLRVSSMRLWSVVAWAMLPLLSFWSHLYGYIDICPKKRGGRREGSGGEAYAGYLPSRSN